MPLCGQKKWHPAVAIDSDDEVLHTIDLTGERFSHFEDYKKRMAEYGERKWTCQMTGKHHLTFEEAYNSEQQSKLEMGLRFTPSMQKALLVFIHHNFLQKKFLVEGMQQILKKSFFEGEHIKMNLKQTVMGKVESVINEKDGSPNSNKENQKKYDIRTLSDGSSSSKLVRGVPHEYLERKTSLSDEDINQFIATYATRVSQSSPWVIAADLKTTHGIKDKVHSLFATSPASASKPKKSTPKAAPAPVEKRRSGAGSEKMSDVERHRLPSTSTSSEDSDSDLQVVRKSNGVAPVGFKAKKQMKNLAKVRNKKAPPLVDLTAERSSSKQSKKGVKLTETRRQSSIGSNKKMDDFFKAKKDKRDTDDSSANDSDDFVSTSLTKKAQSLKKTPSLSPAMQMQKRVDSMVQRAEMHLAKHQIKLFKVTISTAAKSLNDNQITAVKNEQVRKALEKCKAELDEQKIMDKMTADEKTEYLAQKAAQVKQEMIKRRVEAAKIARLKFEDTSLTDLTPLPDLEPVVMPDSVSPSCFGDALMVTEFFHRFRDLLGDDHSKPISAIQLLTDMTAGQRGYVRTTAKLLESMLHTLLADEVAKDYSTLSTKLNSLTTNKSTAAELTRLALRRKDDDLVDHDEEDGDGDNRSDSRRSRSKSPFSSHTNDIDNSILVDLERTEFYDLSVSDQISVLRVLVGRLLDSYSLNEFVDSFRERIESAEEDREKARSQVEELQKRKAEIDAEIAANSAEETSGRQRGTTPSGDGASAVAPPTPDMKTKLQKYREEKAQAVVEQQRQRQVEERQRRLEHVETEIAQVRARLEAANKSVMDLEIEKNLAKRVQALGTDRSHRRYWVFRNGANPGLFVEDGWVGKEMAYSCFDADAQTDKKGSITNFYQPTEAVSERPQTFPQLESNRWYQLSLSAFDQVFAALHPKGERESALRLNIQCLRTDIRNSITLQEQKTEAEKTEEVEDESTDGFATAFKQTLEDTGRATRESGFGGVEDFDLWLGRLASADSLPQLIDLLLECQQGIHDRFLLGRMKKPAASTANKEAESSSNGEEAGVSKLLARWIEMVKECATISRLHVLLYVFDAYIDWDKSLKNQKCRTCRKKKDTENMLLCDDCNDGYHMYCLRPKLKRMPRGDWFCRACKHKHERKVRYTFDDDDDDDEEERIEKAPKGGRHATASSSGRRAHFSDDEDEEEPVVGTRRSKRNLEAKELTIALSRVDEPRTKRAKHSSESDKPSEMEELCTRVFKLLTSSRTCTSLFADLPDVPIPTRSSRKSSVVQNLSDIEKKLHSYTALDEMFADFGTLFARAKDAFVNQPRKLAKLETVEEELSECIAQYAG